MTPDKRLIVLATALAALAASDAHATNLKIGLKTHEGKWVVAEGGGGRELLANRDQRAQWETFTLFDLDGGRLEHGDVVALRGPDGHFVAAEGGGGRELVANRDRALEWERFRIERVDVAGGTIDDNTPVRLRAHDGHYVSARSGDLRADRNTGGNSEKLTLVVVGRFGQEKLSAPFARPDRFDGPVGYDHDRAAAGSVLTCKGHYGDGFPKCYDQHEGSDFMLEGWFPGMDFAKNEVLTATGGLVLEVADGNGDRCFAGPVKEEGSWKPDKYQVICPGNAERKANYVKLLQDDGDIAYYYHLEKDTVVAQVGQRVECGQRLGEVGSSGISSSPHLHFELERDGAAIDPYTIGAWARLDKHIPQRTCNVPAAGSVMCETVKNVFSCSAPPAKAVCQGLDALTNGNTCVVRGIGGRCLQSCSQMCGQVEQKLSKPCD